MTTEIQPRESSADPWTDIDRAFDVMAQHFAESFGLVPFGAFAIEPSLRAPRTDVTDTGKSYRVVAEVPGIPKEKIDIRIRGTAVEIRGENEAATGTKEEQYLRRERSYSSYYRSIELPEPVVAADAKASITNGVLELELPKQVPTASETEVKVAVA